MTTGTVSVPLELLCVDVFVLVPFAVGVSCNLSEEACGAIATLLIYYAMKWEQFARLCQLSVWVHEPKTRRYVQKLFNV